MHVSKKKGTLLALTSCDQRRQNLENKKNKKQQAAQGKGHGKVGYWRRNCLVYLSELIKKKKNTGGASTPGIFVIELYSFPNKSWFYDTGCGTQICNTTQGLRRSRELKSGALNLYVERAKDLLGLIHTDVCSPFRTVSRYGASYFGTFNDDFSRSEQHKLGDDGEPTNYRAALSDPKFVKWLETMNEYLLSIKDNKFWSLMDLHPNAKTVGSKWLFKKNTDMDGW
uniref:Uncharacterized protein n=1 Tax=Tanacetum cinerariifolium TaxID=118510 RepID=A0A699HGQ8_TANCI|nr:hypothetical protein [Tanacetum cinerariifolium]GEY39980.1 hypothetical protein [Tanacetum cinerariifolium]